MSDSRGLGIALCMLLAGACSALPGDVVGTYKVTMKLEENTCGTSAVNSLDKHTYRVQLREDGEHGYWHTPGQTPIQGDYDAPKFRFEYNAVVAASRPDAGPNGCSLVQADVLSGSVDANDEPIKGAGADADSTDDGAVESADDASNEAETDAGAPLQGTHVMTVSAGSGSTCAEALAPAGAFEKLPCVVRYSLSGVPTKSF